MNDTKPKIIAFVSGKGGSGKTTVAIAIAKLLAGMEHPCLLIDFDLATNGASYFFKRQFKRESKGIWDSLRKRDSNIEPSTQITDIVITISNNFDFVPSRTNLNTKGESYDSVSYDREYLKKQILNPLVDYATQKGFHYILIDCQAGYSIPAIAAAESAEMAIIVTEADSISSDASDNLLIQLGSSLPDERRYLVNKIDVRDADTYRNMRNVFQSINRLPPLPFDFDVRNAFGARRIPIDLNNPSPLLFALFETVKYIFTEIFEDIDSYKRENVDRLFEKYDQRLESLLEEKRKLEHEQADIKTSDLQWRHRIFQRGLQGATVLLITLTMFYIFQIVGPEIFLPRTLDLIIPLTVAIAGITVATYALLIVRRRFEKRLEDETREAELSRRIESINKELDHFRSLLWAQSQDFLIDAEVVGETKRRRSGAEKSGGNSQTK
jgi:cellulose biosynthesis protein BcsQ